MSRTLCWLHISDIHFRASDSWRDSPARAAFVELLSAETKGKRIPQPQLVFCTGDIGFGDTGAQTLKSQYADATSFLVSLTQRLGLPYQRAFVVPGNHDISRSAVNRHAEQQYRQMAREYWAHHPKINASIANQDQEYRDAMRRLESYRKFFAKTFPHIKQKQHLHYTHVLDVAGISLQVIGLNSAWACNGSEEDRDVWVGAQAQLAGVNRDQSLRIGLMHHPLEWITKSDAQVLEGRMGNDLHVLLHGHEHEWHEHSFNGGFPVIGTGALSAETEREHGAMVCSLDVDIGSLTRRLYVYSPAEGVWRLSTKCETPLLLPIATHLTKTQASEPVHASSRYQRYFVRIGRLGGTAEIDEYEELVEPAKTAHSRDAEYFRHLWFDVMGPHTVQRLVGDPTALHYDGVASSTRVIQKDNLDAYFLRNVCVPPDVTATANDDELDKADAETSFDVFAKEVSESPLGGAVEHLSTLESENRIRYLIGDAGIGKTLAVLKLIDMALQRGPDEHGYKVVPTYLDLHQDQNWAVLPPAQAVNSAVDRIGRNLTELLPESARSESPFSGGRFESGHEIDQAMKALCKLLTRERLVPFIVVDNGDRFFFEHARYRFFPDFARKRDWHLDETFLALVDRFVLESSLGKIGASVLFVCRKYVYGHCLRISDGADPLGPIRQDHKVYQLIALSHRAVLESRWKLFSVALEAIKGPYQNARMFERDISTLRAHFETLDAPHPAEQEPTLRWLWNLQHQGHRSWLSFLASLPLDVGPNSEIGDRIFGTPHNLIRLYITKMRKKYTQHQGHFPNVFLNDAVVLPDEVYRSAHTGHVHTYWLKYLILRHLYQNPNRLPKGRINSEALITYFVSELKYEEKLVRLAVGSLSDPSVSACIHIVKPDRLVRYIELLELSPRGRMLVRVEKPLAFSFDYLQLVTDDYLLALPRVSADKIFVDADLGHTLKAGPQYVRGARETLRKKIPAVLHFFKTLRTSFLEEARYRGTLERLEQASLVPDFNSIESELLDTAGRLAARFDSSVKSEDLPDYGKVWREIEQDRSVDRLISDYYSDPVPIC